MAPNVFSAPVFFIVFRETLETVIIVSILLAFLRQTLGGRDNDVQTYKKLRLQVWIGVAIGFFICMVIAGALIGVFYTVGSNVWEAHEHYCEGAFCLAASLIITVVGATLLRIGKVQDKWRVKLARALEAPISPKLHSLGGLGRSLAHFCEKYAMFLLPFITVLREGIEAVVFIAGVSFQAPASAIPLPVFVGLGVGIFIGWLLYKGGSTAKLQLFLVASTCLLYLVAAGLFSRSVWHFEAQKWNQAVGGDATETGNGPGSYDIDQSVWHVNCCQPDGPDARFWGIFNAVLGWTNSATYGSVISYNLYWLVIIAFLVMRFRELKGHWPLLQPKTRPSSDSASESVKRVQGLAECKGSLQQAPVPVTA